MFYNLARSLFLRAHNPDEMPSQMMSQDKRQKQAPSSTDEELLLSHGLLVSGRGEGKKEWEEHVFIQHLSVRGALENEGKTKPDHLSALNYPLILNNDSTFLRIFLKRAKVSGKSSAGRWCCDGRGVLVLTFYKRRAQLWQSKQKSLLETVKVVSKFSFTFLYQQIITQELLSKSILQHCEYFLLF